MRLSISNLDPVGEVLVQLLHLRCRVDGDIGLRGVPRGVVLVGGLGLEEGLQWLDPGSDQRVKDTGLVELGDIGLADPLLLRVGVEDRRAILPTDIGALAVALSRVPPSPSSGPPIPTASSLPSIAGGKR